MFSNLFLLYSSLSGIRLLGFKLQPIIYCEFIAPEFMRSYSQQSSWNNQ